MHTDRLTLTTGRAISPRWYVLPALALLAGPAAAAANNAVVIDFHQGRLILGWLGLWLVAALTFAVCADERIQLMRRLANYLGLRAQRRASLRADNAMRELALDDPRMLADMVAADDRADMDCAPSATPVAADRTQSSSAEAPASGHPVPTRGFRTTPFPGLPRHLQYLPG